jgi:hypothetical protein
LDVFAVTSGHGIKIVIFQVGKKISVGEGKQSTQIQPRGLMKKSVAWTLRLAGFYFFFILGYILDNCIQL